MSPHFLRAISPELRHEKESELYGLKYSAGPTDRVNLSPLPPSSDGDFDPQWSKSRLPSSLRKDQ